MKPDSYFAGDGEAIKAEQASRKIKKCRIFSVTSDEWQALINENKHLFQRSKTIDKPF